MDIYNVPAFLSALSVSIYWLIVCVKAVVITPKIGKAPNIIPKDWEGLLSRAIMLPVVCAWIILPWMAALSPRFVWPELAYLGAFLSGLALILTFVCWYYMGNSWRIGIDPSEKNKLITEGPFKSIRHPIYALSMLLMLGNFLTVQTTAMLVVCALHWFLFTLETYREEKYLNKVYGKTYQAYMKRSNRFLPPIFSNKQSTK